MTDSETDDGYLTGTVSERSVSSSPPPSVAAPSGTDEGIGLTTDIFVVVAIHHGIELAPVSRCLVPSTSKLIQGSTRAIHPNVQSECSPLEKTKDMKRLIKWSLPPPSTPLVPLPSWPRMAL